MNVMARGAATFLAILVHEAAATPAPGGAAVDPALAGRAKAAMTRGLDWLKAQQKENGSWSIENYPGLSALGLWAFAYRDHAVRSSAEAQTSELPATP